MIVEALAPAKVNLTLHVTGRRQDGYHFLDMLVAFGPTADRLTFEPAGKLELEVTGPEARTVPQGEDNLILRAARLIAGDAGAKITLEKNLPVMSGIGGGSSDAAATLRGLGLMLEKTGQLGGMDAGSVLQPLAQDIIRLGADVPMCLLAQGCRAQGVGERLTFVKLPPVACLLVNPRVPVGTPAVFRELNGAYGGTMPDAIPDFESAQAFIGFAAKHRNDLEAPASRLAPVIVNVLDELRGSDGCGLARMSGSGATCFALFEDAEKAKAAGIKIRASNPDWWMAGGYLGNRQSYSEPRVID